MIEFYTEDNINEITVTETSVKPKLSITSGFYDACIKNMELSLANDKDCFRKLK